MPLKPINNNNYNVLPDSELWNLFLNGNREAFEYIYYDLVQDLFNYGNSLCSSPELIKDTIHDLFLEIWSHRQNLSKTNNIKFYLLKSLKYKLLYNLKKEKTDVPQKNPSELAFEYSTEQKMIEHQLNSEKIQQLLYSFQKLPSRQREVLTLLYFENLDYDEISELMNINVSSVYTLAWKAVSALKNLLTSIAISFLFTC